MAAVPSLFADNIVQFARLLRAAGLRLGPSAVLEALSALQFLDLSSRQQVQAGLRAVLCHRGEDLQLFDQAFGLFFDGTKALPREPETIQKKSPPLPDPLLRRVTEALFGSSTRPVEQQPPEEIDCALTWSAGRALRRRDFADMSAEELREAQRIIAELRFAIEPRPTRRTRPARVGQLFDFRRTLHKSLRSHGESLLPFFREKREEPPPLCILCDVSGSMARYTEMLLRFAHTLMVQRRRVECFLLGTELHRVTRLLRGRDIDDALRRCSAQVSDFAGGTRLATGLHEFNCEWSRRVLTGGAWLLLISDGLDRDDRYDLGKEAARLHRSTRRLTWCNPLLGFDGFAPLAQGIRALLPHVDDFRPVHNLDSLADLAAALSNGPTPLHGRALSATVSAAKSENQPHEKGGPRRAECGTAFSRKRGSS